MHNFKAIPEVTPFSSFHDLTKFLVLSFTEKKRKEVEEILVKREKRLLDEFEEFKLNFQKLKVERDNLQEELQYKIAVLKVRNEELQNNVDELGVENGNFEDKIAVLEVKNEELQNKVDELGVEKGKFENKIEVLEVKNEELQNTVNEFEVQNGELEDEIGMFEVKFEDLEYTIEVLERQNEDLRNELGELDEKNEDLENKIEALEVAKEDFVKKNEVRNERLEKKWAVVKERLANVKGLLGSIGRGNDSGGRVVTKRDSHDKDSNWKSCYTKSQASFGNPSSKTPPQVESRGAEEITVGAQLGEGGRCSENNIKFKRKRSIYGSDDDKDSLPSNGKTKNLLESGCKKNSLSDDFLMKVHLEAPGVSKANLPPKFSSTSTKRYEDKIGSHENSEPHFTRAISGSVDGINRSAGGDPHAASLENKVVAGFQSGKEIRWKYLADMLSAFEEDDELCMASVCALYRRNISARVSKDGGGFSLPDLVRGTDAVKYLINGDPANKLRRSVEEVKQNSPPILERCKTLAIQNGDQLFEIYQKKLDPFWPKS